MVRVGDFVMDAPLGRGGGGVVWRADHLGTGQPAAVKLISAKTDPRWLEREARATARLDHPGIVRLFDYGRLEREPSDALGVRAGTPWIAMELAVADGRSLLGRLMGWDSLRRVILDVLSALGHAHAHGLIHRDLKPANLLLFGSEAVKIADFGIAWSLELDGRDPRAIGSPAYMAPEQSAGAWRSLGPWTDLYALGRTVIALLTGRPPPEETSSASLAVEVLRSASFPVPDGFDGWLERSLCPEVTGRFLRAADAARALLDLGAAEVGVYATSSVSSRRRAHAVDRTGTIEGPNARAATTVSLLSGASAAWTPMASAAPTGGDPAAGWHARGVGLGLYGLREVPLVGREPEQARLEALLDGIVTEGAPRAVVLRGAAGVGKTRLSAWLGVTAHEHRAAEVIVFANGPDGSGGLVDGVRRWARVDDLDREAAADVLAARVGASHREPFVWTLAVLCAGDGRGVTLGERRAAVRRLIERVAAQRPVVVRIEDAQWSPDAIAFATALVASGGPVLVVVTVRDEGLVPGSDAERLLVALREAPRVDEIALGALDDPARERLVEEILGLEPAVARQVVSRSGGVPLFAVQLVADWVARGVLEPTADGLRLRAGARVEIPNGLHALWSVRIDALLREHAESERVALELGAALGDEIDPSEWRDACARHGTALRGELVSAALRQNLLVEQGGRLGFAHGLLAESLRRSAAEAGRAERLHRACADALAARARPELSDRVGRHLFAAAAWDAALDPLATALRWKIDGGDFDGARAMSATWEAAAERAGLPEHHPSWVVHHVLTARMLGLCGDLGGERDFALRAVALAERSGSTRAWIRAQVKLAEHENGRGQVENARARYAAVIQVAREIGDEGLLVSVLCGAALNAQFLARPRESHAFALEALDLLSRAPDTTYEVAIPYRELGIACINLQEFDAAERWLGKMLEVGTTYGMGRLQATARAMLADAAAGRRQWDFAREHLAAYAAWFAEVRGGISLYVERQLAIYDMFQQRWAEATARLRAAFDGVVREQQVAVHLSDALLVYARCLAEQGDFERAGPALDDAVDFFESRGLARDDAPEWAEAIAARARDAGETALAQRALAFAQAQRTRCAPVDGEG